MSVAESVAAVDDAYEQMLVTDQAWGGSELEAVEHFRQMILIRLGVSGVSTCCWDEDEGGDEDS